MTLAASLYKMCQRRTMRVVFSFSIYISEEKGGGVGELTWKQGSVKIFKLSLVIL